MAGNKYAWKNFNSTTHGLSHHPLYKIWQNMKDRCLNPRSKSYSYYGGRGVGVCSEWLSFENFYKDMIGGYASGLQLDRLNNDGNYELGNCRWATMYQQNMNRGCTAKFRVGNTTKSIIDWSREVGICYHILYRRAKSNCLESEFFLPPYARITR